MHGIIRHLARRLSRIRSRAYVTTVSLAHTSDRDHSTILRMTEHHLLPKRLKPNQNQFYQYFNHSKKTFNTSRNHIKTELRSEICENERFTIKYELSNRKNPEGFFLLSINQSLVTRQSMLRHQRLT